MSPSGSGGAEPGVGRWLPYLAIAPGLGVLASALVAWHDDSGSVFAIALLVAGASFLVGSLLGFLFGIPRLLASGVVAPRDGTAESEGGRRGGSPYAPNTNLEQISDWLTKILVGVGLVELGKLSRATKNLVDFLAPSLGGDPSGSAFALALLTLYSISGFLIVYLLTRVYLGRAFAEADQLIERLDRVEAAQEQQERDLHGLTAATRYLDADDPQTAMSQDELNKAVAAASDLVRVQIFNIARQARRAGTTGQKARAPGLFAALIAADQSGKWHRTHGQLGFALFDAQDFAGAEAALTTAIERRDQHGQRGFDLYEFVRALSRIAQDPESAPGAASEPNVADPILADLRAAHRSPYLRGRIQSDKRIQSWLSRNKLGESDLAT